jgi:hypothetical protein
MALYRITVKTITGKVLTYHVNSYSKEEGMIKFFDRVEGIHIEYAVSNCEIKEVKE